MLKTYHVCFIYFLVITLYFSKDVLYSGGSTVSIIVILFTYLISLGCLLKSLFNKNIYKNNYYWLWLGFLILNTLMILLAFFEVNGVYVGNEDHWVTRSIGITLVSLSFFPIYYFSQRGVQLYLYFKWFALLLLPILGLSFYNARTDLIGSRGTENVVNNYAYLITFIVPYVFFLRKKRVLSLCFLLAAFFLIIIGSKRGALISAIIAGIPYLYYFVISPKGRSRYLYYLLYTAVSFFIAFIVYRFLTVNQFLIDRLNEPGGSNRDIIYERTFTNWMNSESLFNMFFGYGLNSTLILGSGSFAHNDWLEALVNYGIFGVLLYLTLFYLALKKIFKKKTPLEIRLMMASVIAIWSVTSLVSMNYMSPSSILQSMLLAYIVSNGYMNNRN